MRSDRSSKAQSGSPSRFILAMHVEPVMLRPKVEDGRHTEDAVSRRWIAQLHRRVWSDRSQGPAELAPQRRLFRLHDPENGYHGSIDECGGDRRVWRPHSPEPERFRPRDFVDTVAPAPEHLVDPEVREGQLILFGSGLFLACFVQKIAQPGGNHGKYRVRVRPPRISQSVAVAVQGWLCRSPTAYKACRRSVCPWSSYPGRSFHHRGREAEWFGAMRAAQVAPHFRSVGRVTRSATAMLIHSSAGTARP